MISILEGVKRSYKITNEAYNLGINKEPGYLIKYKKEYFPIENRDVKEIFVDGKGWVKVSVSKREKAIEIEPLKEGWDAEALKEIYNKYGKYVLFNAFSPNLRTDSSYFMDSARAEVLAMAKYGKAYDEVLNRLNKISVEFLTELSNKGYEFKDDCPDEWSYIFRKGKQLPFKRALIYRFILSRHFVSHFFGFSAHPHYDPIALDEVLEELMTPEEQDKIVSVKDRVAYLGNQSIAEELKKIITIYL